MKFFNKKMADNAKVILIDFKKLNPKDFEPVYNFTKEEMREELVLCAQDGKLYINSAAQGHKFAYRMFSILTKEAYTVLNEYKEEYKRRYPEIQTFNEWEKLQCDDSEKSCVFAYLAIPLEFARREIEQQYYGC